MSRTEFVELLERGAGPPPGGVDTDRLWRRGRRRRRGKRIAAAGAVAAVAVGVVVVQPWWEGARPGIDIAPADRPVTAALPVVMLPDVQTDRADLALLTEPTGSVVVATYDGMAILLDVDRGETERRRLAELAAGDPPHRLITGDRLVLWGGTRTYSLGPDPDDDLETINEAADRSVFVPSGAPDRFWVRLGTTDGTPAPISQLSVDGQVLIGPTESPGGNLVIGLRDTVVLQADDGLVIWDPRTDRIIERVPGAFAMGSDGRSFAWCDDVCRQLSLTDTVSGTTRLLAQIPDGAAFAGDQGRISPDGRYLATPLCATETGRCALVVLDLVEGIATTVADGWLAAGAEPAWSPDSRRVFVTLEDGRLATYRPGTSEATVVDVTPIDAPYGFGVLGTDDRATERPSDEIFRLDPAEVTVLAAVPTRDPTLSDHVVRDTFRFVWDMGDVAGEPPALPEGSVGVLVFARDVASTCRSPDDVLGVEIVDREVVVLLDPQGAFLQPCPGPEGAHTWTAFAIAIPDHYGYGGFTGASSRLGP